MCGKLLAAIFIGLALILAVLASILPQEKLASIIYFSRFFDVMLPVLAVGALIKYLLSHVWCHNYNCDKTVVTHTNNPLNK